MRQAIIIGFLAVVVALPFCFRRAGVAGDVPAGAPVLVLISPHNEAIRAEFARAFSDWHARCHGTPVRVEWRVLGGTTEIMRYLEGAYTAAARGWWRAQGRAWPEGGAAALLDPKFKSAPPPAAGDAAALRRWEAQRDLHAAFRATDAPAAFTSKVDLFFGGGTYDHGKAAAEGLVVPPWPDGPPVGLVADEAGRALLPEALGGETWRTTHYYGTALSTFGLCYNFDRLADLGLAKPPADWDDLADPRLFGQVGVVDPTKSGSIAKAFEMIIHVQCYRAIRAAGFADAQIAAWERPGRGAGETPPPAYEQALEAGWLNGLRLVQRICANARYVTDSSGLVPQDVASGNSAAGISIDFLARYQAEASAGPDGRARMAYVTPPGGSSVTADPVSLLRGAEHRELAVRFIAFVLGPEGQRLWNYRVGTPGGPRRFALRRLPIRRDFYPSDDPVLQAACAGHQPHTSDALGDPAINPYAQAASFTYYPRWTGRHFNVHRDLIRVMCLDAGDELRAAWGAIVRHGGPAAQPAAVALLERLPDRPEPLRWATAPDLGRRLDRLAYMREWTLFFRASYRAAQACAEQGGPSS